MASALALARLSQAADEKAPTIWRGVYTEQQAARGKAVFEGRCTLCHGEDAAGGTDGAPLFGPSFINNWIEDSVGTLFNKIHTMMPGDAPGTLNENEAVDLTAFILRRNGFPAGSTELEPKLDALSRISIVGSEGPRPVPNFTTVMVVGCLAHAPDSAWRLTKGTEPVRARQSIGSEQLESQSGSQTFRLMDVAGGEAGALQ